MAVCRSSPTRRRRWTLALTLLAFALALAIGGLLWQAVETASVVAIQGKVAAVKPVFTILRLSVVTALALLGPMLIRTFHRLGRIDDARRAELLAVRWRIVAWLVVIEVVVGQNLLGQVVSAMQGTLA
jgi:hypothetical protein